MGLSVWCVFVRPYSEGFCIFLKPSFSCVKRIYLVLIS